MEEKKKKLVEVQQAYSNFAAQVGHRIKIVSRLHEEVEKLQGEMDADVKKMLEKEKEAAQLEEMIKALQDKAPEEKVSA